MQTERVLHHDRPLEDMVLAALNAGTPAVVAEEARRVTARRFPGAVRGASSRSEAYFWGIVRRRALNGDAPRLARSLVVASLIADLAEAGHAPDAVQREVARVYGEDGAVRPAFTGSGCAA
jgi:hypothetical protein